MTNLPAQFVTREMKGKSGALLNGYKGPTARLWISLFASSLIMLAAPSWSIRSASASLPASSVTSKWQSPTLSVDIGIPQTRINAMWCDQGGNCIAVGTGKTQNFVTVPMVARKNNTTSWTSSVLAGDYGTSLTGISCFDALNCVAWGQSNINRESNYGVSDPKVPYGVVIALKAGTWQSPISLERTDLKSEAVTSVSCWSAGNCVIAGYGYACNSNECLNGFSVALSNWALDWYWNFNPGMNSPFLENRVDAVSCGLSNIPSTCLVVGRYKSSGSSILDSYFSYRLSSTGANTASVNRILGSNRQDIGVELKRSNLFCFKTAGCIMIGGTNNVAFSSKYVNNAWQTVRTIPLGTSTAFSIRNSTCVSMTYCVAVGTGADSEWDNRPSWSEMRSETWSGVKVTHLFNVWGEGYADIDFNNVSCVTTDNCYFAGNSVLADTVAIGAHLHSGVLTSISVEGSGPAPTEAVAVACEASQCWYATNGNTWIGSGVLCCRTVSLASLVKVDPADTSSNVSLDPIVLREIIPASRMTITFAGRVDKLNGQIAGYATDQFGQQSIFATNLINGEWAKPQIWQPEDTRDTLRIRYANCWSSGDCEIWVDDYDEWDWTYQHTPNIIELQLVNRSFNENTSYWSDAGDWSTSDISCVSVGFCAAIRYGSGWYQESAYVDVETNSVWSGNSVFYKSQGSSDSSFSSMIKCWQAGQCAYVIANRTTGRSMYGEVKNGTPLAAHDMPDGNGILGATLSGDFSFNPTALDCTAMGDCVAAGIVGADSSSPKVYAFQRVNAVWSSPTFVSSTLLFSTPFDSSSSLNNPTVSCAPTSGCLLAYSMTSSTVGQDIAVAALVNDQWQKASPLAINGPVKSNERVDLTTASCRDSGCVVVTDGHAGTGTTSVALTAGLATTPHIQTALVRNQFGLPLNTNYVPLKANCQFSDCVVWGDGFDLYAFDGISATAPVGNFTATTGPTNCTLSWSALPGFSKYVVLDVVAGTSWSVVGKTWLVVSGLRPGSSKQFSVFGVQDASLTSGATATVIIGAPTNVTITVLKAASTKSAVLGWSTVNGNGAGATGLVLSYGLASSSTLKAIPLPPKSVSVTVTGLVKGNTYRFGLRATNSRGSSAIVWRTLRL